MRPAFVVLPDPGFCDLPDLIEIPKQVKIQNLFPVGPVEPFDIRVLIGLPGSM